MCIRISVCIMLKRDYQSITRYNIIEINMCIYLYYVYIIWLCREWLVGCACNDSITVRHCTKIPLIIISNNNNAAGKTKTYGHQRYVSTWFFGCLQREYAQVTNPFHRSTIT